MLRSPFPGHRRYSITHRAVQRLRELVPTVAEEDDEALRDRLDAAITTAVATPGTLLHEQGLAWSHSAYERSALPEPTISEMIP